MLMGVDGNDSSVETVGPQPPDLGVGEAPPVNGETNGSTKHGGPPQARMDTIAEEDDEEGDGPMVGPVLPRAKKRRVSPVHLPHQLTSTCSDVPSES